MRQQLRVRVCTLVPFINVRMCGRALSRRYMYMYVPRTRHLTIIYDSNIRGTMGSSTYDYRAVGSQHLMRSLMMLTIKVIPKIMPQAIMYTHTPPCVYPKPRSWQLHACTRVWPLVHIDILYSTDATFIRSTDNVVQLYD